MEQISKRLMTRLLNPLTEYGDADAAYGNEILRTTVGSGVHGIAIEGTDDHDEMGVYIESMPNLLGIRPYREDYMARTRREGERSGPGDTDLILYSLSKYLRLAVKGNPTASTGAPLSLVRWREACPFETALRNAVGSWRGSTRFPLLVH